MTSLILRGIAITLVLTLALVGYLYSVPLRAMHTLQRSGAGVHQLNSTAPAFVQLAVGEQYAYPWARTTEVHLEGIALTEPDCETIARLGRIDRLNLTRTQNASDALRAGRYAGVRNVMLAGSDITDRGLRYLCTKRLECLSLANTKVTDAGLAQLSGCKSLWYLSVARTAIRLCPRTPTTYSAAGSAG